MNIEFVKKSLDEIERFREFEQLASGKLEWLYTTFIISIADGSFQGDIQEAAKVMASYYLGK